MRIKIKYFGQLRAVTAQDIEEVDAPGKETLSGLIGSLAKRYGPGFGAITLDESGRSLRPSLIVLVDGRTVDKSAKIILSEGQEVSLITAIAGG